MDQSDARIRDAALGHAFAQDVQRVALAAGLEHDGTGVEPAVFEDAGELGEIDRIERREKRNRRQRFGRCGGMLGSGHATAPGAGDYRRIGMEGLAAVAGAASTRPASVIR